MRFAIDVVLKLYWPLIHFAGVGEVEYECLLLARKTNASLKNDVKSERRRKI